MPECPFANLPETERSRWGESLDEKKMKKCVWVRPELVAQIEFLEWTESDHLRHSKFGGLGVTKTLEVWSRRTLEKPNPRRLSSNLDPGLSDVAPYGITVMLVTG
jgi:ATP-dependent DNA ligase